MVEAMLIGGAIGAAICVALAWHIECFVVIAALALLPAIAVAQQQADPQIQIQACYGKLQDDLGLDLQIRSALIEAQTKVRDLQAELDKLKPKAPPK